MRILVGLLAHQLNSETLRRVHTLAWDDPDGYDVLTCWGQDIRPDETRFQAVTRKYQHLQRTFLAGPYDALLTVEQDMLLPEDALLRLARLVRDGAGVAYGLYVWRYEELHWWNAHPALVLEGLDEDGAGVHKFASMTHFPAEARRLWGQPVEVAGLGLGCTLLPRPTLARLAFRQIVPNHSCDTALALDAQREGLIQVCDTAVVCGHRIGDGRVVWPDPEAPELYRIEQED